MFLHILLLVAASAGACDLPKGTVLYIGCTVACTKSFGTALDSAAEEMGLKVELTTIPMHANGDYSKELSHLDGVLSPGGHDIDPKYYTSEVDAAMKRRLEAEHRLFGNEGEGSPEFSKPEYAERDAHEFRLMDSYFKNDSLRSLPLLGVCYGMQMMAASQGVPIVVDIAHDLGIAPRRSTDQVVLEPAAPDSIRESLGSAFTAAKNHHQAVDLVFLRSHPELYPDIEVAATSNNGKILEMIAMKDRPALGIQFHAERSEPKVADAVFGWFLAKACERRSSAAAK